MQPNESAFIKKDKKKKKQQGDYFEEDGEST